MAEISYHRSENDDTYEMRKLLHQIYGILKSGMPYNPEKRGFVGS